MKLSVRDANLALDGNYHYTGNANCSGEEQPYFVSTNGAHAIVKGLHNWLLGWAAAPKTCTLGGYHSWPGESPWKPGPENFNLTCSKNDTVPTKK